MENENLFPPANRLSVLLASILLAYALSQFVNIESQIIPIQFLGVLLPVQIEFNTLVSFTVAGMTATGTDWLLRAHPRLGDKSTVPHWMLPALTAWIISIPLSNLPFNPGWWGAFALGGLFLLLVLIAEYIAVDLEDNRQPIAAVSLSALAYTMFLILAISVGSIEMRLFVKLPMLFFGTALVSLRAINLQSGQWQYAEAGITALVVTQISAVLHYTAISPIGFGLAVLGPIYAINNFILNVNSEEGLRQAVIGPGAILGLLWVMALWIQ